MSVVVKRSNNTVIEEQIINLENAWNPMYPNPTSKSININAGERTNNIDTITIYNALGINVKSISVSKNKDSVEPLSVDVSKLPSGIYLCKVHANQWQSSKLFIVK